MASRVDVPEFLAIGDAKVPFSTSVKILSVPLDCSLEMGEQIHNVVKAANFQLRRISSIRRYLTPEATATLVSALILSRLDYCNSLLYGCHEYLLDKLQRLQNNCARMIRRVPKFTPISPHLAELHWLPIRYRIKYKLACLCYQSYSDFCPSPSYMADMIPRRVVTTSVKTRLSSDTNALKKKHCKQ